MPFPPGLDVPLPRVDAPFDPFDPDASCGAAAIPTQRIPGSMLIVFDRSGSMNDPASGSSGPSRWDVAEEAINAVLATTSDDLNVGLLFFPTGVDPECDVTLAPGVPAVEMGPLSTTRAQIMSQLAMTPDGGVTPVFDALRAGYAYLDTLTTEGPRGVILVTDGENNCDGNTEASILAEALERRTSYGYLTYAIGLDNSSSFLSTLAFNGGTPRTPTCVGECYTDTVACNMTTPCATGTGPCLLGMCLRSAMRVGECCHYDVSASGFRAELGAALEEISQAFLDSCIFELPRGTDPTMFDPSLVNVGVTFTGESRTTVARSTDASVSSWNFTSDANEAVVIQGPLCERLLTSEATVEIVLGCPTILF